jgi:hypothetical protein
MKKTTLTEIKAEQAPTGGVLVGKRKGQTIIHDEGSLSGYLVGKTHAEGGIKAVNKSTGQPLEMQGGEVVITAPAVADQTKNQFNGKMMTNREILSQINVNGGGVAFADGGDISKVKHTGASYNYGGRTMTDYEIIQEINSCVCEHSEFDKGGDVDYVTYKEKYNKKYNYRKNKSHTLKEISKDTGVSMKGLRQIYNKGIGAYKTNPSSVRPNVKSKEQWAMARVYSAVMGGKASKVDSNELKMKKGGDLVKDAKSGNTPARDLNNYNDVLDLDADGVVGAETGLYANGGDVDFDVDGTGGADASSGVGAFDNGGEVGSFLNYYFEELKDFLKNQNNIILNDDYTFYYKGEKFTIEPIILSDTSISESMKEANFIVYDLDDEIVGNIEFNPNANKKFIANSEFFEWNNKKFEDGGELDFLDDVERIFDEGGSTDLPKVEYVTITSVGNRTVYSELVGEIYGNIEVLKYDLNKFFKEKNETPSYIYIQPNDSSNNFGISFKKGKNTVLNFNPLTGQNSDIIKQLDRRYPRSIKKYDWNDFYQNKNRPSDKQEPKSESTSKSSESRKFSSGEIEVFNQIDALLEIKNIGIENVAPYADYTKDSYTRDFDVVNTDTGDVFKLRVFKDHLGVSNEDSNRAKSSLLLSDFLLWKISNPTSTSKSGERPKVSYLIQKENEANIGDIQGLKNYIDKLFTKGNSRVGLEIVENGKIVSESIFYIYFSAESDPSDKRHFNVLQDLDALKYAIFGSDSNLKYNWDEFFEVESKEEAKQEEQSIRNFELEKKYLTQRINALSSELDLKRPILSNEEIAFYQRDINKFVSKLRVVSNDEMELKPIQARVNGVYKVKWGDYTKQYPETDTLSINGVKSELTFEEYLTVRTPEFKSFFGNWEQAYFDNTYSGVSKIINPKTKEPMPVFHGTNVLFTEWKTYETNNAHYFAVKREMSDFFATSWETRSDKAGVDSKAIKALNPNTGTFLYRCFLDIRNPIDFSKFGVEKRPIKEFLLFLKINYNIGDYDFWTNLGNARGFTSETRVYAWQIIRLWQNFTKYVKNFTTYDGYIFYEYIPDTPFGGLENASLSFCAFESNQIKFADAYEFNALSNDSRFDFGGTL